MENLGAGHYGDLWSVPGPAFSCEQISHQPDRYAACVLFISSQLQWSTSWKNARKDVANNAFNDCRFNHRLSQEVSASWFIQNVKSVSLRQYFPAKTKGIEDESQATEIKLFKKSVSQLTIIFPMKFEDYIYWFGKMAWPRILFRNWNTSKKSQGMVVWVALESLHHAAIAVVPGHGVYRRAL